MSIISNYWRYFANVDTTADFKFAIDDIYNWFFRKLWERGIAYTEKPFADAPISVSDFPGQEWGFRPLDIEVTGNSIVGARSLMLDRTRLIHRDDAPVSEEPPKEDTHFLYTSSFCLQESYHEGLLWHAWLPFAVNVEWGTIYYAYVPMCYLHMQPRIYFCPQHFRLDKDIYAFSRKRVVELFTGNAYELSDARDSFNQDGVRYDWSMFNYIVSVLQKHPKYIPWDVSFRAVGRKYDIISDVWQRDPFLKQSYNNDNPLASFPYAFYDDAYDLSPGTIEKCWGKECAPSVLLWLPKCFGNLTQSILQTYETCGWFLPMVLKSLRDCVPFLESKPRNIQQFLHVDKPTLKAIFAEEDPSRFLFYCLANFRAPTSYAASCRLYERVRIKDAELLKNDKDGKYALRASYLWRRASLMNHSLTVNLDEIPFASLMFYIDKELYKRYTISAYYQWLWKECFIAAKSGKYSKDTLLIEKICFLQEDIYRMEERMAKRKPEIKFTPKHPDSYLLSHNVIAAHDAITENFNAYEKAHKNPTRTAASIKRLVPCYRGKRGNCVEDDTYEVQQPMSIDDILDEGIQLHHCVGSYYQDIVDAKGDMLIYFMREKAFPYQALITIQVNRDKDGNYFIVEASGDSNREPTRQEKAFLDKWIAGFNAHISKFTGMKRKEAIDAMCRDDMQVWCQWTSYSLDDANSTIEKALKVTDWDTALKGVCDDYELTHICNGSLYIAAMYGLCCKSIKYTDFIS